jgi:hypothetical protein
VKDIFALKLYTRVARLGRFSAATGAAARVLVDHLLAELRRDGKASDAP